MKYTLLYILLGLKYCILVILDDLTGIDRFYMKAIETDVDMDTIDVHHDVAKPVVYYVVSIMCWVDGSAA
jgi:hypothetical protein